MIFAAFFGSFFLTSCGSDSVSGTNDKPSNQNNVLFSSVCCKSNSGSRVICPLTSGTIRSASLQYTYSGSCAPGDIGFDPVSVWVQNGCQALIYISGEQLVVPSQFSAATCTATPNNQVTTMQCDSNGGALTRCPATGEFTLGRIVSVTVNRQDSWASCGATAMTPGASGSGWYIDTAQNVLYVAGGCRALFNITYTPR